MSIYRQIFNLLNKTVVSSRVIFAIIGLLDDYSCNPIHDKIFDLLFEFLESQNNAVLENVRKICIGNLEN